MSGMSPITPKVGIRTRKKALISALLAAAFLLIPLAALCETYGIKNDKGEFIPKLAVTVGDKEITLKKTDPKEEFKSISLTVNRKNRNLVRNVGLLNIQWINRQNQAGKPLPFSGPRYNPETLVFQDSMGKSLALKIIDKSPRDLFTGKDFADLFTIHIDDRLCVSSESYYEKDRTVKMGAGRDLSIDLDKTSVVFNEDNFKKGEIINVDNRSSYSQTLGIALPQKGLLYSQIIRKPEQTKIPKENWERFTLEPDSGVFIVLIPEPDPARLAALDGAEITVKVWDGNKVRETRKIPIRTSSELRSAEKDSARPSESAPEPEKKAPLRAEPSSVRPTPESESTPAPARQGSAASEKVTTSAPVYGLISLWVLQVFSLVMLVALAIYGIFFMLPKIQVLEDRLAKNEVFIHGSREAIREELEEIKEDILRQCRRESSSE